MKSSEEIVLLLEELVRKTQEDSTKGLENLNKKVSPDDAKCDTMFMLSKSYYIEIARYAWAYRAKLIMAYELQSLIKKIKDEQIR